MIEDSIWITPPGDYGDAAAEFIKRITPAGGVSSAKLTITATGVYEARIDSKRVGDFILAPGCTVYSKRLQYQKYDITDMVGGTLVVTVGKGWHRSRMSAKRPEINTKPCALIAEIELTYTDGSKEYIRTDESWMVRRSNIVFNDMWDGETCDASIEPSKPERVCSVQLDKCVLIPQEGECVREMAVLKPKKLIITPKGERVIDFGQEITGYVEISINAKSGERIELSCAEVLDKDGNFYNDNYRSAKSKMTYICRDGKQSWKPCLTFYGFRYIRLDEFPGEIQLSCFRAISVYSDIERTGYVRTSNAKLNRLFENVIWSQCDNFVDIPTDCPQRDERMGWTGDAQVFAKTACYNYNVKKFYEKWLGDVRAEQRKDGSVADIVPNFWNKSSASTAWGDVITVIPWQLYLMYGDKDTLYKNFDAMKRWVDYMTHDSLDEYLWTCRDDSHEQIRKHYGDWLALDAPEGSIRGITSDNFIASAFYAYSTLLFIKTGRAIGKDMTEYEELYRNIKNKFKKTFTVLITQTENVLALVFDLTDNKAAVAKKLAEMIRDNGNRLKTGFVGTPYLLHALSENGYSEVAYDLLLQEEYPSWLYEVNQGATTIWEHWDGIRQDGTFWSTRMNSYNHYAYGSVMDWVYSVSAGIRPAEEAPGFERVVIEPHPTNRIESLEAEYNSINGKIISKWTNTPDGVKYEITVPVPAEIIIDGKMYRVNPGIYIF